MIANLKSIDENQLYNDMLTFNRESVAKCCEFRTKVRRRGDKVPLLCPQCKPDCILYVYQIENKKDEATGDDKFRLVVRASVKVNHRESQDGKLYIPRTAQLVEDRFVYIGFAKKQKGEEEFENTYRNDYF